MKRPKNIENKSDWIIGGGILAAVGASLCCIGPLVLTLLGITGAAALAKFETIRIPLILVVALSFGMAGRALYKKKSVCEPDSICADPIKYRRMIYFYWIGLFIAVIGITSPYWIVLFF